MKSSEFKAKFADYAMLQQIRYGIPASVTLAQCAIESGWGDSEGARKHNIYFGIKAQGGSKGDTGQVAYYDDDKPHEAFCVYSSAEASFEGHSKFLTDNGRYAPCFNISIDNYRGWLNQLQACKYATKRTYAKDLIETIEANGFAEYDRKAQEIAKQLGVECGYARKGGNPSQITLNSVQYPSLALRANAVLTNNIKHLEPLSGNFAMPLDFTNPEVRVSSDYLETRKNRPAGYRHQGIDIRTGSRIPLCATEDNGTVVYSGKSESTGNEIKIKYPRGNGEFIQCTYMHLDKPAVDKFGKLLNKNDSVSANDLIGMTGSSGRSTGVHLHFEVARYDKNGKLIEKIDPTKYLAELQVRSGQYVALKDKNGTGDYLASARSTMTMSPEDVSGNFLANKTNSTNPKKWLEALMAQNNDLDSTKDFFSALLSHYTTSLIVNLIRIKDAEKADAMEKEDKEIAARQPERETVHVKKPVDTFKMIPQLVSQNFETLCPQEESRGITQKV